MNIFTAVKYCCILHGCVCVMPLCNSAIKTKMIRNIQNDSRYISVNRDLKYPLLDSISFANFHFSHCKSMRTVVAIAM